MYICLECGYEFEEGDEVHWEERHGLDPTEGSGEQWSGCPRCLGAYEEVTASSECPHIIDD